MSRNPRNHFFIIITYYDGSPCTDSQGVKAKYELTHESASLSTELHFSSVLARLNPLTDRVWSTGRMFDTIGLDLIYLP